jgi:hypothetical protein
MTDDIVTRLRGSCDHLCIGCTAENAHDVGLIAADEIERLRALNKTWRTVAEAFAVSGDPESLRHAGDLYAKAVRRESD